MTRDNVQGVKWAYSWYANMVIKFRRLMFKSGALERKGEGIGRKTKLDKQKKDDRKDRETDGEKESKNKKRRRDREGTAEQGKSKKKKRGENS